MPWIRTGSIYYKIGHSSYNIDSKDVTFCEGVTSHWREYVWNSGDKLISVIEMPQNELQGYLSFGSFDEIVDESDYHFLEEAVKERENG